MAIMFHLLIFSYTNILLVASITLDVFYPEDMLMLSEYDEMCSHHNYPLPINSKKFGCQCHQPCQCQNRKPPPLVYSPPVQYSPPLYQPPAIPTQQPVTTRPQIFTPTPPTFPPVQQNVPNSQSQDQTKYNSVNYEHTHSETQQRPGRFIRRQSPRPYQSQIYSQIYFPEHQYYNFPNRVRADCKRSAGSIFVRGRDSRSTLESSRTQNGNDVAPYSSIALPQNQQLNNAIDFDNRNKRHDTNPLVYSRGIDTTAIKTPQYEIIDPSRKLVKTESKPIPSQSRSSFNSPDKIYINYPHGNSNNNFGSGSGLDIRNMVNGNARSPGLNGIRVIYPPDKSVHLTHVGQLKSSQNSQMTPIHYTPYIYTPNVQ